MQILKFGGTSVSSPLSLANIADILLDYVKEDQPFKVVVSALRGVTDLLATSMRLASTKDDGVWLMYQEIVAKHDRILNQLFPEEESSEIRSIVKTTLIELKNRLAVIYHKGQLEAKQSDHIYAFGELLSANIITYYLNTKGLEIDFLDARKVVLTDESYGNANVDLEATKNRIRAYCQENPCNHVVTGFIASTNSGHTTVMGRGGSDYSATLFALALNAKSVVKWTDVNGVLTSNPTNVKDAFPIDCLSYDQLHDITKYSSGVLVHSEAIYPLAEKGILFAIRNTFNKSFPGTTIQCETQPSSRVISILDQCDLIRIASEDGIDFDTADIDVLPILTKFNIGPFTYGVVRRNPEDVGPKSQLASYYGSISHENIPREAIAIVTITGQDIDAGEMKIVLENFGIKVFMSDAQKYSTLLTVQADQAVSAVNILHSHLYPYKQYSGQYAIKA